MFSLFKKKPTCAVAVLTPFVDRNNSPLYPKQEYAPGNKWLYYDLCLQKVARVDYFDLSKPHVADGIAGYQYVFVHETAFETFGSHFISILERLKSRNKKLYWFEIYEKSLYSGALFLDGFIEIVDKVFKHQLLDFDFLKGQLQNHENNLAPYANYGFGSSLEYHQKLLPSFRFADDLETLHIRFPFDRHADKFRPFMYPFSFQLLEKGIPVYQAGAAKKHRISYVGRRGAVSHLNRNIICSHLKAAGIPVDYTEDDYVGRLKSSDYFLALGLNHSSLRTFDVLAFDTILVHYDGLPYHMWPEFKEYETFLPIGNPHLLFSRGGFGLNSAYLRETVDRFKGDIGNDRLRARLLDNQRQLFHKLTDPRFIAAKLEIDLPVEE